MKILYIGSSTELSLRPFQVLIQSKHQICGLAFDGFSDFTVMDSNSIQSHAFANSIPLIKLDENYKKTRVQIETLQPDVILVSCYSRLLPSNILSLAKKGSFNAHPSLLPRFRGGDPLFWQFQKGECYFGVTVHCITSKFDAGDIILQQGIGFPDGISRNNATTLLANLTSDLFLKLLEEINFNNVAKIPQDNTKSNYDSYPTRQDYQVSPLWSAKRIYNFISAYKGNNVFFVCELNNKTVKIIDALSFQEEAYDDMKGRSVVIKANKIKFSCKIGYVECQIKKD